MKDEEKKALEEFFRNDFSSSEREHILLENPHLLQDAQLLNSRLEALRSEPVPTLRPDFTERVMERLSHPPGLVARCIESLRGWRRITLAASLAAAVLAGLILVPRWWMRGDSGILVREEMTAALERRYWVRFSIRLPEARSVEVAGDFNRWSPTALKPSPEKDGTFVLELPMEEGTYVYAFLVDGKKWIPDPAVSRKVADGFGNVNSLINL